jgi:predicted NUDIX family phosphoesterase
MVKKEKILVVPRLTSNEHFFVQGGNNKFNFEKLVELLKDGVYGTRYLMEENFHFKQLIPYIAFISNGKVLVYKRSNKIGEGRLVDKYSLGVGGHVDLECDDSKSALDVFLDAAIREVKEEINIDIERKDLEVVLSINDDSNDVGKVHFGVGFIIKKDNLDFTSGEIDKLVERKLMSRDEVEKIHDKFETWSQIFYDDVVKKLIN